MKNNFILNLCRYDLRRVLHKKYFIFFYLIIITVIMLNSGYQFIDGFRMWDISLVMQNEVISLSIVASIVSLYTANIIFFDMKMGRFINVRMKNKVQWFISKTLSVVLANLFIILSAIIISIIIGAIFGGLTLTWSYDKNMFLYIKFYSPYKIIFINIITFTAFLSFCELIYLNISLFFKNYKVGIIIMLLYIISSPLLTCFGNIRLKKYFAFTSYILFGNRNYYCKDFEKIYLTVKQGAIIPVILFIIIVITGLITIKKIDIDIWEKKNG